MDMDKLFLLIPNLLWETSWNVYANGESPIPILATASPADCFDVAIEAFRIAVRHTTPVFVLFRLVRRQQARSRGGSRASRTWSRSRSSTRPSRRASSPTRERRGRSRAPWAIPGTPGLEHRIGGLEKQHETGDVSHDAANHELMWPTARGEDRADRRVRARAGGRRARRGRPARGQLGQAPPARSGPR